MARRDVPVDTVPDPTIEEATDAIVRITSSGLCGSDLHLYEVIAPIMTEGDILGHEPVGSRVTDIALRDRVVIPFNISCGHCGMCGMGLQSQCETTQVREYDKGAALFGYTKPYGQVAGGQAELLRVPQPEPPVRPAGCSREPPISPRPGAALDWPPEVRRQRHPRTSSTPAGATTPPRGVKSAPEAATTVEVGTDDPERSAGTEPVLLDLVQHGRDSIDELTREVAERGDFVRSSVRCASMHGGSPAGGGERFAAAGTGPAGQAGQHITCAGGAEPDDIALVSPQRCIGSCDTVEAAHGGAVASSGEAQRTPNVAVHQGNEFG